MFCVTGNTVERAHTGQLWPKRIQLFQSNIVDTKIIDINKMAAEQSHSSCPAASGLQSVQYQT